MKTFFQKLLWYITPMWLGTIIYKLTGYTMTAYFEGENFDKLVGLEFRKLTDIEFTKDK